MRKKISIVIPCKNEQGNIIPLCTEIQNSLQTDFQDFDYEIIIVDDGSDDNTWNEIKECKIIDSKIYGIRMNTSQGQAVAMYMGFQKSSGDIVYSMDGDGQNDPADMKMLYDMMIEQDLDLVTGWRRKRKDPTWMLVITNVAKLLRKMLINDGVKDSGCTFRVYKKQVVKNLHLWGEMHRFIIALSRINGYSIGEIQVNHRARTVGKTKYNWQKSIKGFIDLLYIWFIKKYESRPLHLFGGIGLLNFFIGFIFLNYSFYQKIFFNVSLNRSGWMMLGIFFAQIGIVLFIFGIMIDIMIRTYYNTSKESRYIVKDTTEQG
ncbi:MAG: glycosyltransferase family 2 protein [Candidatus Absconditabacteria bacterium]